VGGDLKQKKNDAKKLHYGVTKHSDAKAREGWGCETSSSHSRKGKKGESEGKLRRRNAAQKIILPAGENENVALHALSVRRDADQRKKERWEAGSRRHVEKLDNCTSRKKVRAKQKDLNQP